jgi:hypothetical protein
VLRLGAAAVVSGVLVACTRGGSSPEPTAPGGPEDPDRALRAEQGRAEADLSALYRSVTTVLSGALATRVATLGSRHDAYRQAIDPDRLAESPSAAPSESATVSSTPSATAVPTTEAAALADLLAAETSAARARARAAARAVDPELARYIVLAGTGAAAAAQVLRGGSG